MIPPTTLRTMDARFANDRFAGDGPAPAEPPAPARREVINPDLARHRGLGPLTTKDLPSSEFIRNATASLERDPSIEFALVDAGNGFVEIWRAGMRENGPDSE